MTSPGLPPGPYSPGCPTGPVGAPMLPDTPNHTV